MKGKGGDTSPRFPFSLGLCAQLADAAVSKTEEDKTLLSMLVRVQSGPPIETKTRW